MSNDLISYELFSGDLGPVSEGHGGSKMGGGVGKTNFRLRE